MSNINYKIKSVVTDDQDRVRHIRYTIQHSGATFSSSTEEPHITTLDQDLELSCSNRGHWDAVMRLHGNMGCSDPKTAIKSMANWLQRMSAAINGMADTMNTGLQNPIAPENYSYTLPGLIKRLKDEKCPLDPIEDQL